MVVIVHTLWLLGPRTKFFNDMVKFHIYTYVPPIPPKHWRILDTSGITMTEHLNWIMILEHISHGLFTHLSVLLA